MKKFFQVLLLATTIVAASCSNRHNSKLEKEENEENEKYDNPKAAADFEFNRTYDRALGIIPKDRLWLAMDQARAQEAQYTLDGTTWPWTERGPIYDTVVGGNGRGQNTGAAPNTGTSGNILSLFIDKSDPTGNTAFCAGVAGGIWKCTNFLTPNCKDVVWTPKADYLALLNISSICQNPKFPDTMYAATGEYYSSGGTPSSLSPRGRGVFRSADHGETWTLLGTTSAFTKNFKIACDSVGNVYLATNGAGLRRSKNGGTSWTNITPTGISATGACTDIEFGKNGRLHASFGYQGTSIQYRYAVSPATTTVTWTTVTIPTTGSPTRFELAAKGDTVYGITADNSSNIDYCFRSVNGGGAWTKMNATAYSSFTNTQGWYTCCLAVDPDDANNIVMGQLDIYASNDGGATVGLMTDWVGSGNYAHADHHDLQWYKNSSDGIKRILTMCDGGIFMSEDDGASFKDRNKGLGLKQFYSCAIHPNATTQPYYFLAGAQDNGIHQIKTVTPVIGTATSREVVGGDGMHVDIDQVTGQYQFTSYVGIQFAKSTNSGTSFGGAYSANAGAWDNPWDYDDLQSIILGAHSSNNFFRWNSPKTNNTATTVTLTEMGGMVGAVTASPYTSGRAFFGSAGNGAIVRVNNTKTTTGSGSADVTDITPPSPGAYVNCIAIGTNDSNLIATYTNYGATHVWLTNDGGANWTDVSGNLPDIPVYAAVFHPTKNTAAVIGTELGIYSTGNLNGASTVWVRNQDVPYTRVNMLRLRKSDNLLAAATFGRGLWTANILDVLPLKKITLTGNLVGESTSKINWQMVDASNNAKFFIEYSVDGINFKTVATYNKNTTSFNHVFNSEKGYYRVMGYEPGKTPIYSNIISLKSQKAVKGINITIAPNPVNNAGKINLSSNITGEYTWQICNVQGSVLHIGRGNLSAGGNENINFNCNKLSPAWYVFKVTQNGQTKTSTFIKQ